MQRIWNWSKTTKLEGVQVRFERGRFEVLTPPNWRLLPFYRSHGACCPTNCTVTTVYIFGWFFMYVYEARTVDVEVAIHEIFGESGEIEKYKTDDEEKPNVH